MQQPLQVTFRHMQSSESIDAAIEKRVAELDQFYDRIISCRVVVEAQHKHHHHGNLYHVRIEIRVPGTELVVKRAPGKHQAHEDVYVTIRDAFDAMRRQLEDYSRRQRGDVKSHEAPPHGKVSILVPEEDFGRIETTDGRDIYFHRNSVINANFDELKIGTEVRFAEEAGDNGPQASTVNVIGKHHVAA